MPYLGKQPANVPVTADDIPDNSITSAKILDGVITIADIGANAVGNSEMADDAVGVAELSATGTASNTTFLRGDNSWQTAGSTSASDLTSGTLPSARLGTITGFTSTGIDDNATSTAITIDSAENVGIGVVPETWNSVYNALQIGTEGYLIGQTGGGGDEVHLGVNAYNDGAWKYIETNEAQELLFNNGTISFNVAPSGTADAAITWTTAMKANTTGVHIGAGTSTSPWSDSSGTGSLWFKEDEGSNNNRSIAMSAPVGGYSMMYLNNIGGANGERYIAFYREGAACGTITMNGTTGVLYGSSSDYRLKENVDYDWDATTRLKQLKPARFNFIADAGITVDGFLAHEAQTVVPECVTGTKDAMKDEEYEVTPAVMDGETVVTEAVMGTRSVPDMQGIDQSKLVPLLVKTIQELEARITALEA